MTRSKLRLTVSSLLALMVLGFATVAVAATDSGLVKEATQTIALYKKNDPGIAVFFEKSAGYAVFPSIIKAGVGIGGARGTGVLFERGKPVGRVTLTQATVGAQLGGQELSEVIFFETPQALNALKAGKLELAAQASAVALKAGAAASARFENGIAVFTATKGGLMAEASIGGQKLSFEPFGGKK
jgi:lipid-binding SYLF domain-containing protein